MGSHLAFGLRKSDLVSRILIPKFYDPEIAEAIEAASAEYETPSLEELLEPGELGARLGTWIPREEYGTGSIPYVRTSDLANWRIRPDYKKGVSEQVYQRFKDIQDVAPGDILFVAHGTYLVGNVALVTENDKKLVLQDHVLRLRVPKDAAVGGPLLLAALSTPFVRRQVRARQFSADIIDKIGDRYRGIRVPVPRSAAARKALAKRVVDLLSEQAAIRSAMAGVVHAERGRTRERAETKLGFVINRKAIRNRILIPKYYDPTLERELVEAEAQSNESWVSIDELVSSGAIALSTGVEVGKMAYGTGPIPFVRTSDIADGQVKIDFRHGVSEAVFEAYAREGALDPLDILVVRDGTYLVGSNAMVDDSDVPALFCGGLLRIRVVEPEISNYAVLALLNHPLVQQQIRAKQFSRDVIDTLGQRFLEVKIPDPRGQLASQLAPKVEAIFRRKSVVRTEIRDITAAAGPLQTRSTERPGWSMR